MRQQRRATAYVIESRDRGAPPGGLRETSGGAIGARAVAALAAAVAAVAALVLLPRVDRTPWHGDEAGWIASGYYYTDLVLRLDFTPSQWDCERCGPWGSLNMPLPKWLIGLPLRLDPTVAGRRFDRFYNFGVPEEENVRAGNMPPPAILRSARRSVALFGVLCCVLVFAVATAAYGPVVGLIAAGLLLGNRVFLEHATRAMTDIHYAVALLAIVLVQGGLARRQRPVRAGVATGALTGIAASIKLTGLIVGGVSLAAGWAASVLPRRVAVRALAVCGVTALAVIYALNPSLLMGPGQPVPDSLSAEIGRFVHGLRTSSIDTATAREDFPRVFSVAELPLLFARWQRLIAQQAVHSDEAWKTQRLVVLHRTLFRDFATMPGEWLFVPLGLWIAVRKLCLARGTAWGGAVAAPPVFFAANYLTILFLLRLNWDRYYLPTIIAGRVLVALAISTLLAGAWRWGRRTSRPGGGPGRPASRCLRAVWEPSSATRDWRSTAGGARCGTHQSPSRPGRWGEGPARTPSF